ncbi:MAG: sugar phosphate nucleotidyltransferase, partial [Thermodesulfobacteriota bacterium]|nr:sugar phosphate nucleotidyltransferase [Thermodesulfobacteriota bacterium]
CFTYGDGLSDINLTKLIAFHKSQKTLATVTAVRPPGRFGSMRVSQDKVFDFVEKPTVDTGLINGGFFVLSPKVLDYIETDNSIWEKEPIQRLTSEGELSAFEHTGFWQSMDTLRDKMRLDQLWESGEPPWKIW